MTTKPVDSYLRSVSRQLHCRKHTREALIEGLAHELTDFLSEKPDAAFADLCEKFGHPRVVSRQLLEDVDASEVQRCQKRRKVIIILSYVVLLSIIVAFTAFFIDIYIKFFSGDKIVIVESPVQIIQHDDGTTDMFYGDSYKFYEDSKE